MPAETPQLQLAQMLADLSGLAIADVDAARALLLAAAPPVAAAAADDDLGRATELLRLCAVRDRLDGAELARPRAHVAAVEARYTTARNASRR